MRLVLRDRARRDIEEAIDHYLVEAGETTELGFVDAFGALAHHAMIGS